MEYLLPLLLLLYGVIKYDFKQRGCKNRKGLEITILVYVTALSALQYYVGADMSVYVEEYKQGYGFSLYNLSEIWNADVERRQLGWLLLLTFCQTISSDFVLLKIIQAITINLSVYFFIKKQKSPFFLSFLFYFLFLYPILNYNTLRASFSVAIFLWSFNLYKENRWLMYYISVFAALLFHSSAICMVILPLFKMINIKTPKSIVILSVSFIVITLSFNRMDIHSSLYLLLNSFMGDSSGLRSSIYTSGMSYLQMDNYNVTKGIIAILLHLGVPSTTLFFLTKKYEENKDYISIIFALMVFTALDSYIPIFYRFNLFITVIYYCAAAVVLKNVGSGSYVKNNPFVVVILFVLYFYPIRTLFLPDPTYGYPPIVQYYPYHSVFDPVIDPLRQRLFYIK